MSILVNFLAVIGAFALLLVGIALVGYAVLLSWANDA